MQGGSFNAGDGDVISDIDVTKRTKKKRFSQEAKRKPIKALKMADYFKQSSVNTKSILDISKASTAEDPKSIMQDQLSNLNTSAEDKDTIEAEQKWREEMDARLEQDILDNVDVNFIFNKGVSLTQGLLDPDRIYSVMNKLKELAYKQLQSGSDKINYADIVNYLRNTEGFFHDEVISKEQRNTVYTGERINEQD